MRSDSPRGGMREKQNEVTVRKKNNSKNQGPRGAGGLLCVLRWGPPRAEEATEMTTERGGRSSRGAETQAPGVERSPGGSGCTSGAEEDPTQFRSLSSKYLYSNVKPSLRL